MATTEMHSCDVCHIFPCFILSHVTGQYLRHIHNMCPQVVRGSDMPSDHPGCLSLEVFKHVQVETGPSGRLRTSWRD